MDETREMLQAILRNLEMTNAKVTAVQDELLHFRKEVKEEFARIDERFDRLESRMDKMESRMDKMEIRMDKIESRMDRMEIRQDKMGVELSDLRAENAEGFKLLHLRMDEIVFDRRKEKRHRESLENEVDKLSVRLEKVEEYISQQRQ